MKCFAILVVVAVAAVALARANPVDIETIETAKTNDVTKAEVRGATETPGTANVRDKRTLFGGPGGAFRIPFSGDTVPLGGYSSYSSVFNYPYGFASSNPFWPPPLYFYQL